LDFYWIHTNVNMDKYAKVKKIGEGAFGLAYLARAKENGGQVVLKEINMNRVNIT